MDFTRFQDGSAQHALRLVPQIYFDKLRKSGEPYSAHIFGAVDNLWRTLPHIHELGKKVEVLCFHDVLDEAAGYDLNSFNKLRARYLGLPGQEFAHAFDEAILMAAAPQLDGIAKIVATTAQVHTFGSDEAKVGHVFERGNNGTSLDYTANMSNEKRASEAERHRSKWLFSIRHTGAPAEVRAAMQAQYDASTKHAEEEFGTSQARIEEKVTKYLEYFAQNRLELSAITAQYAARFGRQLPNRELQLHLDNGRAAA